MRKESKMLITVMIFIFSIISTIEINAQLIEPMKGGERICWANNSFTSFYGPLDVAINRVYEAADPNFPPIYHQRTGKACGIIKEFYVWGTGYVDGTKTVDTIRNGNWDYVLFQSWEDAVATSDVSDPYMSCSLGDSDYPNNQDTLLKYMDLLDAEAKAVGARTIWFMPQVGYNWHADYLKAMESADKVRAEVEDMFFAPLINAWDSVRNDYPSTDSMCPYDDGYRLMLYSDCGHQNANGVALNAFTFYTIFSGGLSGEGLTPNFPYTMENPEYTDYFARVGCAIGRKILLMNGFPNDFEAPTIPEGVNATDVTTTTATLQWDASTDNIGVTGYAVYMDGELYGITPTNSIDITGLTAGITGITFTVRSIDAAGHYSSFSDSYPSAEVFISICDTSRQGDIPAVGQINCSAYHMLANKFDLSSVEYNVTKATFRIYKIGTSSQHDIRVFSVTPDTWYEGDPNFYSSTYYSRTEWDTVTGNTEAGWQEIDVTALVQYEMPDDTIISIIIQYTADSDAGWTLYYSRENDTFKPELLIETDKPEPVPDTIAPTAPSNVVASNIDVTTVTLDWTASTDSAGVAGYQIYHDGSLLATHGNSTSMSLPWLTPGMTYNITLTATDINGNMSEHSSPVTSFTTLTDSEAPTAPADLASSALTQTSVDLSWTASTDNVGVTVYNIYNGATLEGTSATTTYSVSGLSEGTAYTFTVTAEDEVENESTASNALNVTTLAPDSEAPTAPTGLVSTATTQTSVSLSWTASTDNLGVTEYDVYNGVSLAGFSATTTYTVTGLTAETAYTFSVIAKDAAGNESAASNTLDITTAAEVDTEAPTAPSGLTSTATTQTSISLSWTASTDNVAVTVYNIYNGATFAGSSATTTYTVSGLSEGTAYSFIVKAEDAAGNESSASNSLAVSTTTSADTEAPSAPTGLTSTAKTNISISLSWTASTDNVGVTEYDVYNGTVLLGTSSTTTYTATGLTAATAYTLSVKAKDAAGNESAASNTIVISTNDANGINSNNNSNINIFPNPASNKVFVNIGTHISGAVSISLYNSAGMVVLEKQASLENNIMEINTEILQSGIYHIVITSDIETYNSKLIISK